MITPDTLVRVSFLIPMRDIEIIDAKVSKDQETRHHPAYWDITYDIEVDGVKYEIDDYQDDIIDEKLKQEYEATP